MKRFNSSLLIAAVAVLLIGFYSIDLYPEKASVFSLPDLPSTSSVESAEKQPVKTLQDFNDAIVDIADKATPTVVTIRVTQTVEVPNSPFSRFFGDPRGSQERQRRGLGSGVIVSEEGYIITNAHVVEGADEIAVGLSNGEEYDGEVVGTDPRTDIAVVKINAEGLSALKIGNSDEVRVGEMVLAIGSPLGENLAHSVSMGIVSAKDRAIQIIDEGQGYENFIQTDAAINPGNSGGALVNMDGELVGINSAIASRSGGNDGIGFAVPSNLAKSVMESLIESGEVVRGYVGITMAGEVDRTMAKALGLKNANGVIVGAVEPDGPADMAGLKEGDVIQKLNGEKVETQFKFRTDIATSSPGTEVTLGIVREGKNMSVDVTLGELPDNLAANMGRAQDRDMETELGFRVQPVTPEIAQRLGLDASQQGVIVTDINQGSNAFRQGLRPRDVIVSVARNPVEDVSDFRREMSKVAESEDKVALLKVIRGGVSQYVAFEL
ncbi:MAG: Do family serine endopeptidase [Balneolaceae bacterium]|nr:Do family serine endopeptidase [Balneolaceae bacterium]